MKRWTKWFLLLLLMFIFVPCDVDAAVIGGTCGTSLTWELSEVGVLTIKGNGKIPDCQYILHYNGSSFDAPWADYIDDIQQVIIQPGVTYIGNQAFAGCENLRQITIPNSVTGLGDNVFENCMNLREVQVPTGVKDLGMAFCYCQGITKVIIPKTQTAIADFAFKNCRNLETVILGDQITKIGTDAFYMCVSLKEFKIPSGVTEIGTAAFWGCDGLTEVTIPDGVESIGRHTFYSCNGLREVYLPESVKNIRYDAFGSCSKLQDIYYGGSEEQWSQINIGTGNTSLTDAARYYDSICLRNNPFEDVMVGEYYYDAVLWAVKEGITTGTAPNSFNPDGLCTRGEMITFLWRATGCPTVDETANPFTDVLPDDYYYMPVLWAYANDITTGVSSDLFGPERSCNRSQMITFLWRLYGSPKVSGAANPFTDVLEGTYYYDAVLWAYEVGVTTGISATAFAPDDLCLRSQVVTFLYRNKSDEV